MVTMIRPNNKPNWSRLYLESLKNGEFTDCVFLVGPENGEQQEFRAIKTLMMMMSEFMRGLFNSPLCPPAPIRIKDVDVKTFKLVIEYIHIGELATIISCEEAADLAVAADFLLIETLKDYCRTILILNLKPANVWGVLNKSLKHPELNWHVVIDNSLRKQTDQHLKDGAFLNAELNCLLHLLQQDHLKVESEMQLFQHCLRWAKAQPVMMVAMRKLLPHLRLLTLSSQELATLPDIFMGEELVTLLKFSATKKLAKPLMKTLCPLVEPRKFTALGRPSQTKKFVEEIYHDICGDVPVGVSLKIVKSPVRKRYFNSISLKAVSDMYLTQIHVNCKYPSDQNITFDHALQRYRPSQDRMEWEADFSLLLEWDFSCRNEGAPPIRFKRKITFDDMKPLRLEIPFFIPKGKKIVILLGAGLTTDSQFTDATVESLNNEISRRGHSQCHLATVRFYPTLEIQNTNFISGISYFSKLDFDQCQTSNLT